MKTLAETTKQKLTAAQFTALSTLAYYCLKKHHNFNKVKADYEQVSAVAHVCSLLGINDNRITEVRNGDIEGLQNIARFANPEFYKSNYTFDPYN